MQAKDLRKILRAKEKGDLEKTLLLIERSLQDQPINPGAKYVFADLLSTDSLEIFNLDSARLYIIESLSDLDSASADILEELSKNEISESDLQDLYDKIATQQFDASLGKNSIDRWAKFMTDYPEDPRFHKALYSRDSIIYEGVKAINTWQEYQRFMEEYPESEFFSAAKENFEVLVFEDKTRSDNLSDYIDFLRDYPETPYRKQIEEIILERSTVDNSREALMNFIRSYPNSHLKEKAVATLYHLSPDEFDFRLSQNPDSLRKLTDYYRGIIIPFSTNQKIGFMDTSGVEIIKPRFSQIPESAICGGYSELFINGKSNGESVLVDRNDRVILSGDYDQIKDLGLGILFVKEISGKLLHKTGFTIQENVTDASVIDNRWITVEKNSKIGMISIFGYPVTDFEFDEIYQGGAFIVIEKDGEIAVTTTKQISQQIGNGKLIFEFKFDDYEVVNNTTLVGFKGSRECLLDQSLRFLVPWGEYEIFPDVPFHYAKSGEQYFPYGELKELAEGNDRINDLQELGDWIAFSTNQSWTLVNRKERDSYRINSDSLVILNEFAAMEIDSDSIKIYFKEGKKISVPSKSIVRSITGLDAYDSPFITVDNSFSKAVWDNQGNFLFDTKAKEITYVNDSLFRTRYSKYGLIDNLGKTVLKNEFEAITIQDNMLTTLKKGKIGAYDLSEKVIIETKYESRIEKVGKYYKTSLGGQVGLIDRKGKSVLPFEYLEIMGWTDSLLWLKEIDTWSLYSLNTEETIDDEIQEVTEILSHQNEKLFLIQKETGKGIYGVDGEIIKPVFNDIKNVGTIETPIFFAEQYSEAADIYIVVYYNKVGEKLKSVAFKPSEYDQIYCDN